MKEGKKKKAKKDKRFWLRRKMKELTPLFTYHHIGPRKPGNRCITTCMLVDKDFNIMAKGVSFKNPDDQPNTKIGRQYALSRAKGALTFWRREELVKSLGDDYIHYREPAMLERVRRDEVFDLIAAAQVFPVLSVGYKIMFRPKVFSEEERYVIDKFIEARRKEKDGGQQEDGKGQGVGTERDIDRPKAPGVKYRVRRVNADSPDSKRESA